VAGIVILREAGGTVTAYDQSPLIIESGRLLATNGLIHEQLSKSLIEAKKMDVFR
jgi:myo-inositol-1(or 4)-monophosphatase